MYNYIKVLSLFTHRRASTSSINGFSGNTQMSTNNRKCNKNDLDEREYHCLRPTDGTSSSSKPMVVATLVTSQGHKNNSDSGVVKPDDCNPDIIPGCSGGIHINIYAPGRYTSSISIH